MMKRIKFLSLLVATFCLAAVITSCGPAKVENQNKIVIWESYNSIEHAVFKKIIANFKKTLPADSKIEIELKRVPFSGLSEKVMTAASAGDLPDICRIDTGDVGKYAIGNLSIELDQFGARDHLNHLLPIATSQNLMEVTDKTGKKAKHIYGITDQVTCIALYYNKEMLKKAGVKPPKTISQLIAAAKKLTNKKEKIFGLGLNNSLWWHLPWLYVHGADVLNEDKTKCTLNSPESVKTFQFLRDLYAKHQVEGGAWISGATNPDQGFLNGKYAMIMSGQWMLKSFVKEKYGVSLFPGTSKVKSASNMGGTSMVIFKSSKNPKISFDILKYITSYEAQKLWSEKTNQASVNKKVNAELKTTLNDRQKVFLEQMNYIQPRPKIANYSEMEILVNNYFYSILEGKVPVKKGLDQVAAKVETEILPNAK